MHYLSHISGFIEYMHSYVGVDFWTLYRKFIQILKRT